MLYQDLSNIESTIVILWNKFSSDHLFRASSHKERKEKLAQHTPQLFEPDLLTYKASRL